jgi:hypothetical protein
MHIIWFQTHDTDIIDLAIDIMRTHPVDVVVYASGLLSRYRSTRVKMALD